MTTDQREAFDLSGFREPFACVVLNIAAVLVGLAAVLAGICFFWLLAIGLGLASLLALITSSVLHVDAFVAYRMRRLAEHTRPLTRL